MTQKNNQSFSANETSLMPEKMGFRKLGFNFDKSDSTKPEREIIHAEYDTEQPLIEHELLNPENADIKVISKLTSTITDNRISF